MNLAGGHEHNQATQVLHITPTTSFVTELELADIGNRAGPQKTL